MSGRRSPTRKDDGGVMGGLNRTVPPNSPGSGSSDAGRGEVKKTDSSPVRIHPRILRFGPGDVTDDPADRAKGETSETRESGGNCFIFCRCSVDGACCYRWRENDIPCTFPGFPNIPYP